MTRRPRWTVPTAAALLLAVSLGTVALAQDDGDGSAAPAEDVSGTSVPRGPFVDFCPTPAQTEEHLRIYGFDYKPTVACTSEGEVKRPPGRASGEPADPDEGLTEAEAAEREKQRLLNAEPLPHDGDPCTIDARYADGERVAIIPFVCPEKEVSAAEFARGVFGP